MEQPLPPTRHLSTHDVSNQPDPGAVPGLWEDADLKQGLTRHGADMGAVAAFAGALDLPDIRADAESARRDAPELAVFDRSGARLDEVRYGPGYHRLMALGLDHGYSAIAWDSDSGGHVSHAAMVYLLTQVEPGICCPLTMTYAAVPALRADADLAAWWEPRLTARAYDPAPRPLAGKSAATLGMAMTEKQGGSDVRAASTRAAPDGAHWRLWGHKWFCSAPMSDGFLTLAQTEAGLGCFLVPRWLEDGRNAIRLQRLKDKLGNTANASAEIEYEGAFAHLLGAPGQGVRTILEMVHHTRLDTAMAPAGLMRAAAVQALWWARSRRAFGQALIAQPLMAQVLAELAVEAGAALSLGLRIARAFDGADDADRALARIGVALAKFVNNKRCIPVVAEAMEALGGMGYVADTPLPMLYREAPLNGIWEGSGNVICLDILRSLARDAQARAVLDGFLTGAAGQDARYDAALRAHRARWPGLPAEAEARWFSESLAVLLTAAVLMADADPVLAEGYAALRLEGARGAVPGALPALDAAPILARWEFGTL